jgi:ABC-type multidrug transport system fused ATPase/permease subunit
MISNSLCAQTGVALKRIATYLDEDEVSCQVSSLKKTTSGSQLDEDCGLGIENGSFKWNEVEEVKADGKDKNSTTVSRTTSESATAVDEPFPELNDHRFELKDISVVFPEGELTVITGPTASGKTALLVCGRFQMYI